MSVKKITESKSGSVPEKLASYLAQLEPDESALLEAIFQTALLEPREIRVVDLWERKELPVTYWILLMSGVNRAEEMDIANTLLSWQTFFGKHSARVRCIQSSETNEFLCCFSHFGTADYPVLIFSDSPDMESYVKIEPELLFNLSSTEGNLQRFLITLHSRIATGGTLSEVRAKLLTEKFWSALKIAYGEAKGFISFSASKQI
jgi:hypothetical protein